jgi:hypothetical protein
VGWLYHELKVCPPLTVMIAPWSPASRMMSGLVGLNQDMELFQGKRLLLKSAVL